MSATKEAAIDAITPDSIPEGDSVVEKEETKKEERDQPEEDIQNILEPRAAPRVVILEHTGIKKEYIQRPLTLFKKLEFFGLVGTTIDEAMEGEDGLRVNDLFGTGEYEDNSSNLDSFLSAAAKVAHYAPSFLKDCYLIWLDVPPTERRWAADALDNMSDEEGIIIIETFIDQNWESIDSFFSERLRSLGQRVQAQRKKKDDPEKT